MREDYLKERLVELNDKLAKIVLYEGELQSEIEDVEQELTEITEQWGDEHKEADDRERAADMNAVLRDIGGGIF